MARWSEQCGQPLIYYLSWKILSLFSWSIFEVLNWYYKVTFKTILYYLYFFPKMFSWLLIFFYVFSVLHYALNIYQCNTISRQFSLKAILGICQFKSKAILQNTAEDNNSKFASSISFKSFQALNCPFRRSQKNLKAIQSDIELPTFFLKTNKC